MRPDERNRQGGRGGKQRHGRASSAVSARRRKLGRRRRIMQISVFAGAAVLSLLLLGAVVWGLISRDSGKEKTAEQQAEDVMIAADENDSSAENGDSAASGGDAEGDASANEDETAGIVDNRRVQNTATEENHKTNGLAICMYHYVYDEADPPDDLNNNYIEVHALEEELKYLVENDYFFPTWEEVRQYVNGELLLPEKSVVLTFDDGAKSFLKLGIPLFDKYEVPATSFLITSKDGEKKVQDYQSEYVTFQSHSDNMHRAGGNIGHGGIFTAMSHDDAVADLKKSIEICGHGDAFAYPYGDYTDDCRKAVEDAGFLCAVTTENRRAEVGDDPLLLPRVRMVEGQSLEGFINLIE